MQFHIPWQSKDTDIMAHNTMKQHVHMNTDVMLWMTLSLYECVYIYIYIKYCTYVHTDNYSDIRCSSRVINSSNDTPNIYNRYVRCR